MKENNKITFNPEEKIYFLCYPEDRTIEDICLMFWNKKRHSRVPGWINKLKENGWVNVKWGAEDGKKHIRSTPKGIYEKIIEDIEKKSIENKITKIKLTEQEKTKLYDYLSSDGFIYYVNTFINSNNFTYDCNAFDIVKEAIGIHSIIIFKINIWTKKYRDYYLLDTIDSIKNKSVKSNSNNFLDYKIDFSKMGLELIRKLQYLTSNYVTISDGLYDFIKFIDPFIINKNQKIEKKINGNGHGLN